MHNLILPENIIYAKTTFFNNVLTRGYKRFLNSCKDTILELMHVQNEMMDSVDNLLMIYCETFDLSTEIGIHFIF